MAAEAEWIGFNAFNAELAADLARLFAAWHLTERSVVPRVLPDRGFLGVALRTGVGADGFRGFVRVGCVLNEQANNERNQDQQSGADSPDR